MLAVEREGLSTQLNGSQRMNSEKVERATAPEGRLPGPSRIRTLTQLQPYQVIATSRPSAFQRLHRRSAGAAWTWDCSRPTRHRNTGFLLRATGLSARSNRRSTRTGHDRCRHPRRRTALGGDWLLAGRRVLGKRHRDRSVNCRDGLCLFQLRCLPFVCACV